MIVQYEHGPSDSWSGRVDYDTEYKRYSYRMYWPQTSPGDDSVVNLSAERLEFLVEAGRWKQVIEPWMHVPEGL